MHVIIGGVLSMDAHNRSFRLVIQAVVRSILDKVWETGDIYKAKYEGGSNMLSPLSMICCCCVLCGGCAPSCRLYTNPWPSRAHPNLHGLQAGTASVARHTRMTVRWRATTSAPRTGSAASSGQRRTTSSPSASTRHRSRYPLLPCPSVYLCTCAQPMLQT